MALNIVARYCGAGLIGLKVIGVNAIFKETPGHGGGWAETPKTDRTGADIITETPTPGASKRRSRWDETPVTATPGGMTPSGTATPGGMTPGGTTPGGSTPGGMTPGGFTPSSGTPTGPKAMNMATPTPGEKSCFLFFTLYNSHIFQYHSCSIYFVNIILRYFHDMVCKARSESWQSS